MVDLGRREASRQLNARDGSATSTRRRYVFIGVLALLVMGVLEGASYLAGLRLQEDNILYAPTRADDAVYATLRHPILGWAPETRIDKGLFDRVGSRVTPAFPDPDNDPPLVSPYGDSWTFSSDVDHEHAMGNVLAKLLGRRVNNFGVEAHGTDQAYLRFKHNTKDGARIVVLGHLSENIVRNVNQFRGLIYKDPGPVFAPRFVLSQTDELQLIPPKLRVETIR